MEKHIWKKAGLAAVILLAPGGFILGATLAANHYRRKAKPHAVKPEADADADADAD